ncbi:uncharacterized protein LOC135209277 [Macrobrachium nipponense]|uniref:uncharacterized protein LOC135209277 n=1 Tax=Macrobrachium nipponense TaxID=159736 RepID=UPI0030C7C6AD
MKNSKAVGLNGIPTEAWKGLDEEGIDILWQLMKKIMEKDIVLVAENKEELEGKLERLRYFLESRGLMISRKNTEYMSTQLEGDQQTTIKSGRGDIKKVHKFKYLGSVIDNEWNMEEEIKNQIQCGWNKWGKVYVVICDRKVPIRFKGRVHKAGVRPAMPYELEEATTKENRRQNLGHN